MAEQLPNDSLANWWVNDMQHRNGRWTWAINYPISQFAIVSTRDFATRAAARRDAYRAIRLICQRVTR